MTFRRARFPATALGAVAAIWLAGSGVAGIQTRPGRLGVGVSRGAPPASQSVATSPLGRRSPTPSSGASSRLLRARGLLRLRQPPVERDHLSVRHSAPQSRPSSQARPTSASVPSRTSRTSSRYGRRSPSCTDIRRGNLQELLMYKALIEMSPDRAEFLSLLFARPRPAGVGPERPCGRALPRTRAPADEALYRRTLAAIGRGSREHHSFALRGGSQRGSSTSTTAFHAAGPTLSYNSSRPQRMRYPTYAELQQETDGDGQPRGYLASEANFRAHQARSRQRNLLVPLVGDFAGAKALRAVGAYLGGHGAHRRARSTRRTWRTICSRMACGSGLPRTSRRCRSTRPPTFIRACFNRCPAAPGSRSTTLLDSMPGLMRDFVGREDPNLLGRPARVRTSRLAAGASGWR